MPLEIGYAVMLVAIFLCFMASKRDLKEMRFRVDRFAAAYLKLSNYVSPKQPRSRLLAEPTGEGGVHVLPLEMQPEEIQFILRRGKTELAANLYKEMEEITDDICNQSRRSRGLKIQFAQPISDLCYAAHTFVEGSKDLKFINNTDKEDAFNSFLNSQLKHRKALLKRISKEGSEAFFDLNKNYDLTSVEKSGTKPLKQEEKQASTQEKPAEQSEQAASAQEKPAEQSEQAASAQEKPAEQGEQKDSKKEM